MYVTGQPVGSVTNIGPGGISPSNANVSIGFEAGGNFRHFPGLIDEVEIFDRALSPTEIATIYCAAGKCKCGDGRLDPGEQCDDGNRLNGDCCSSTCLFEAAGGSCADDGNACTTDLCSIAGTCVHSSASTDGTSCDDGNACTQTDTCQAGACTGGSAAVG